MKYILLFPGQGSQIPNMGKDLASINSNYAELWQRAEKISGLALREIFWEKESAEQSDTKALQPALTVVNITLWHYLSSKSDKIELAAAAGHSLGEFSALAATKFLDIETILQLVCTRGKLMSEANLHSEQPGAMAAILKTPLDKLQAIVESVVKESGLFLAIANYNSQKQFVISGQQGAIDLALAKIKEIKGRGIALAVQGAFHTPLMQAASEEFSPLLQKAEWQKPLAPIYCNSTGQIANDPETACNALLAQMTSPVLWSDSIQRQYHDGHRNWLELGPKGILGKMIPDCLDSIDTKEATEELNIELVVNAESMAKFL